MKRFPIKERLVGKLTRARLDPFIASYATGEYTLDIGCADSPYRKHFPHRVGLDIQAGRGVDVIADAHALPFPDNIFDFILCTEVLEHLHTPAAAIDEMRRVLKPGGRILLTTRFVFPLHDVPHDYFRYTKYGLKHLFKDWELVRFEDETPTMGAIAVLLQRIAFQTELRGGSFTKLLFLLMAQGANSLQWLIKSEYGSRSRSGPVTETNVISSGYYLVARKRA